jgi:hypothetical protein
LSSLDRRELRQAGEVVDYSHRRIIARRQAPGKGLDRPSPELGSTRFPAERWT